MKKYRMLKVGEIKRAGFGIRLSANQKFNNKPMHLWRKLDKASCNEIGRAYTQDELDQGWLYCRPIPSRPKTKPKVKAVKKPHIWVVEMRGRIKYSPTVGVRLCRNDAVRELSDWKINCPVSKFRIAKYQRVSP